MNTNEQTVKVKDLLPQELQEAIKPEKLAVLQEEFDKLVESKVNAQIAVAVKAAEVSFDNAASERLEKIVLKLDESNKIALKKVYEKLTESHKAEMKALKEQAIGVIKRNKKAYQNSLATLKEKYEVEASLAADNFRKSIVTKLNEFVISQIDKRLPYKQIKEAVRNTQAIDVLQSFKSLLNFNEFYASKELKKPILEAHEMITESKKNEKLLTEKNASLIKELNESKAAIAEYERQAYLASKLAEVPSKEQRDFVKRVLENAPIDFIKKNFDYTLKNYRTTVLKENATLAERAKGEAKSRKIAEISRKKLSNILSESAEVKHEEEDEELYESTSGGYAWLDKFVDDLENEIG